MWTLHRDVTWMELWHKSWPSTYVASSGCHDSPGPCLPFQADAASQDPSAAGAARSCSSAGTVVLTCLFLSRSAAGKTSLSASLVTRCFLFVWFGLVYFPSRCGNSPRPKVSLRVTIGGCLHVQEFQSAEFSPVSQKCHLLCPLYYLWPPAWEKAKCLLW